MLIDPNEFDKINVLEELSSNVVDDVAYSHDLVARAIKRRTAVDTGITMPWSKMDQFMMRPGEFILYGGYSGHRKSQSLAQIMLHAASKGHRVGIMSLEVPVESTFDMLAGMSAVVAQPTERYLKEFAQWSDDRIFLYERQDMITPAASLQAVIGLRKFMGADIVVVDGMMCIDLQDDLNQEKRFAAALASIAKKYQMTIVLVHHSRKPQGHDGENRMPDKHSFLGTSRLVNLASSCVIVWDNKAKANKIEKGEEVDDDQPDYLIHVAKHRNGKWEGICGLYHHPTARILCNSRQRQYRPIEIRQDNRREFEHGDKATGRGNGQTDRPDTFTGFDGLDDGPLVPIRKRVSGDPFSHESCS